MCKVIAVANQKGGVGKTTTTINLGIGLKQLGKKVLLVDMDSQANLSIGLGYNPETLEYTIPQLINNKISNYNYEIEKDKYVLQTNEGVDLLASDIRLCSVETKLLNVINRESMLKGILKILKSDYDYILIDCVPSLGILNINSLVAADSILIPVQAHYYPLRGMEQLLQSIFSVQAQINSDLKIEGILLTMFDKRTKLSKEVKSVVNEIYSENFNIFKSIIVKSTKIAEAPSEGKSIFTYNPKSEVAKNYQELALEVVSNE